MLIEKNESLKNILKNKMILLTGAGGGIGFETAKAFVYMGANVTIAEINREKGQKAEQYLNNTFRGNLADFYEIDLADEKQVAIMAEYIMKKYGCPYAVFNNATITKIGAIDEVDISFWDKSYAVNLRAPLLLAQKFLPAMKEQNNGVIVFVSSSGASPYMGAYEIFKTAQVELSNTLAMELENTNVHTFTIGPGLVKTDTAMNAIKIVAASMKMSTDEFYTMNSQHILDVESAGVGFALSVLGAKNYHGQEIGSIQVLMDYNLTENEDESEVKSTTMNDEACEKMQSYLLKILKTFEEQYGGWHAMNLFERQWVLRDFKKTMGLSAEQALDELKTANNIHQGNFELHFNEKAFFEHLKEYWEHQLKLLQGYEKNKNKLNENTQIIKGWISDIENVLKI
jgi:NAD(P)-dependent dehydrogenase (short-subunit alcohol dehydrogenase family)